MDLSIVTTLYLSAPYLPEFHRRITAAAAGLGLDYELILVNDGSPDDSQAVALELFASDPRVRVIELSRNYGHHKAIMTGLAASRGDIAFFIDCDLEEPPEDLDRFHRELVAQKADVVFGIQQSRKGGWFRRVSGRAFYWLFNVLSTYPVPENILTSRLMTRDYVRSLVRHRDQEVFLAGLFVMTGFRQVPIVIEKRPRSETSYSLLRRFGLVVNGITSFSNRPLLFIFYLSLVIVMISGLTGAYLVARRIIVGYVAGWASLMVSFWFLGGLIMFSLGIIGLYLSKVFTETKRRPYTVVRSVTDTASERAARSREETRPRECDRGTVG